MNNEEKSKSQLSPQIIWRLNHHEQQEWGIYGYEPPKKYFGASKSTTSLNKLSGTRREANDHSQGVLPQPMTRESVIEKAGKKFINTPAPWSYDPALKWGSTSLPVIATQRALKQKKAWQNISSNDPIANVATKRPPMRIEKNAKKNTYIDQIITFNTKKDYPHPGPNAYFMDQQAAKRFYSQKKDLVSLPVSKNSKRSTFT